MNAIVQESRYIGNGLNSNPLQAILENIIMIIKNNYNDFINSKNRTDDSVLKYIGNSEIIKASLEIQYVLKKTHEVILMLLKSDIDNMYQKALNTELSYFLAGLIIFCFYIFVFF